MHMQNGKPHVQDRNHAWIPAGPHHIMTDGEHEEYTKSLEDEYRYEIVLPGRPSIQTRRLALKTHKSAKFHWIVEAQEWWLVFEKRYNSHAGYSMTWEQSEMY